MKSRRYGNEFLRLAIIAILVLNCLIQVINVKFHLRQVLVSKVGASAYSTCKLVDIGRMAIGRWPTGCRHRCWCASVKSWQGQAMALRSW